MSSSTNRSTSEYPAASGVFQQALVAKLLRLVCDTAVLHSKQKFRERIVMAGLPGMRAEAGASQRKRMVDRAGILESQLEGHDG